MQPRPSCRTSFSLAPAALPLSSPWLGSSRMVWLRRSLSRGCWLSGSLGPQLDEIRTAIGCGLGSIHDGLRHVRRRERLEFSDLQRLEHARVIAAGTDAGIDHPGSDFGDLDAVTLQLSRAIVRMCALQVAEPGCNIGDEGLRG